MRGEEGRAERLVRASVSAFCSLTRPTRKTAAQLDDLTLPLYDQVPADARRYIAAALSECAGAPIGLVRRLAAEPVEISAPILLRSAVLGDIDLVSLIAREGLAHARAIAGRTDLNPAIARLIGAMEVAARPVRSAPPDATPDEKEEPVMTRTNDIRQPRPGDAADATRARLRAMMAIGGELQPPLREAPAEPAAEVYPKLRDTALTGVPALFQTALADAADISFAQAVPLVAPPRRRSLMLVLRGLGLTAEQAFLLVSAADPASHRHPEAIRLFVEHFALTHVEAGRDEIRRLRGESIAALAGRASRALPVSPPATAPLLKAS
jgi:uncharacterized protein (DUF2336 family)